MRRTSSTSSSLALVLAAGTLALAAQDRGPGAVRRERLIDDGRTNRLADVSGLDCLACHAEIGEEWRDSGHAIAWQDELYHEELKDVRRSQRDRCYGCHAPEPLAAAGWPQKPAAREDDRHLGVHCIACHLDADGQTILGPLGVETVAHLTRRAEELTPQGQLCVSCHATTIGPVIGVAKDYVETNQAEVDTCVDCHMPAVRGPIANDPDGERDYPERSRRSHRLESPRDPEFLARAFRLEVELEDGRPLLRIGNRAGHRIPGTTRRRIAFRARVIDAVGDVVDEKVHTVDHRRFLPVDGDVVLELERPGVRLELEVTHDTEGLRAPVVILARTFEL